MPWPGKWPKSWRRLCRRRSRAVVKVIFISVRFSCPFWGMGTGFSFCQNVNVRGARLLYPSPRPESSGNIRFSCKEVEAYGQRYAALACHGVFRMPDFTACEWLRCKRMAVFFRHLDICFLLTEMSQIEEKRPGSVRLCPVFRPFFSRCAEVAGMTCGEKKCFFSQTVFRLAEIDSQFCLTK